MNTRVTITVEDNPDTGEVRVLAYNHGTARDASLDRTFTPDDAEDTVDWIAYAVEHTARRVWEV